MNYLKTCIIHKCMHTYVLCMYRMSNMSINLFKQHNQIKTGASLSKNTPSHFVEKDTTSRNACLSKPLLGVRKIRGRCLDFANLAL